MFTLAHELAHIWLGQSAVSDAQALRAPDHEVERWCNRVAAELLVPIDAMRDEVGVSTDLRSEMSRLARRFKVSTLVVLRRMHDAGALSRERLWSEYAAELDRLRQRTKSSGGNFYLTLGARTSKRFARALVISTLEGQNLLHRGVQDARPQAHEDLRGTRRELGGRELVAYLLDANVFISAKNLHYGLDFCPAFWEWLIDQNGSGRVFSIEKVADEVVGLGDDLSKWAEDRGNGFFLPTDTSIVPSLGTVSTWATSQQYEQAAVSTLPPGRGLLSRRPRARG